MSHSVFVGTSKLEALAVTSPKVDETVYQAIDFDLYKNALINGGIEFSQRGTYSATSESNSELYHVDRWKDYRGGVTSLVLTRNTLTSSDLPFPSSLYSWKSAAGSTATGQIFSYQYVEDYGKFKGKTVTFSAIVRSNNSNTRLFLTDGVGYTVGDAHSAGSGNWQLLTLTRSVSASATLLYCAVGVVSAGASNVAITSGDYYEFSAAVLNVGTFYMPYQPRPLENELRLCQRYYEKSYDIGTPPNTATNNGCMAYTGIYGPGYIYGPIVFKTTKRVVPSTVYTYGPDVGGANTIRAGVNTLSVTYQYIGDGSFTCIQSGGAGPGTDNVRWHWTADAEIY